MNRVICLLFLAASLFQLPKKLRAQDNYVGYGQVIDIAAYEGKSFTFSFSARADSCVAFAAAYGETFKDFLGNFIGKAAEQAPEPGKWTKKTLTGKIPKKAKTLYLGILYYGSGELYFDSLHIAFNGEPDTLHLVKNAGFEETGTRALEPYRFSGKVKDVATITEDPLNPDNHVLKIVAAYKSPNLYGRDQKHGNYADVNGVKLYYETYGEGQPLLLLHGALQSINVYSSLIPILSKKYKVIAVDTRGHGKSTADTARLTYELYAGDMYQLLNKLQLDSVNVLGWSDGGNTGLILAMQHPEKVRKLAVIGAVLYNNETSVPRWVNDTLRSQIAEAESMDMTPERAFWVRVKNCLLTEPNIDPKALQAIKCPTLVMAGQHDIVKPAHTKLIASGISHAKLKIFSKASHDAPIEIPGEFCKVVDNFMSKE